MKPFLKWAGGKRWLLYSYPDLFAFEFGKYLEPFVGGAATFFALTPNESTLGDTNRALMNVYTSLKYDWSGVVEHLRKHARMHCDTYYYEMREARFRSDIKKAAQFIYLNRTCWNGLYRENLAGQFNVPRGTKNTVIFEDDDFEGVSRTLRNADLVVGDFEKVLQRAREGDLVYVDPPYTVKHNNNGFVKYNEKIFSWSDQERLAREVHQLSRRGVKVVVSNAFHASVLDLYADFSVCLQLDRASVLSGDSSFRGRTKELLALAGFSKDGSERIVSYVKGMDRSRAASRTSGVAGWSRPLASM